MALDQRLPHAFPASWLAKSLNAYVVFERSIDGGWHNLSGTSDCRNSLLEQVAWVFKEKKNSPLTINNYLLKCNGVTIIYIQYTYIEKVSLFVVFERQTNEVSGWCTLPILHNYLESGFCWKFLFLFSCLRYGHRDSSLFEP